MSDNQNSCINHRWSLRIGWASDVSFAGHGFHPSNAYWSAKGPVGWRVFQVVHVLRAMSARRWPNILMLQVGTQDPPQMSDEPRVAHGLNPPEPRFPRVLFPRKPAAHVLFPENKKKISDTLSRRFAGAVCPFARN